jgi:hypothetical protein
MCCIGSIKDVFVTSLLIELPSCKKRLKFTWVSQDIVRAPVLLGRKARRPIRLVLWSRLIRQQHVALKLGDRERLWEYQMHWSGLCYHVTNCQLHTSRSQKVQGSSTTLRVQCSEKYRHVGNSFSEFSILQYSWPYRSVADFQFHTWWSLNTAPCNYVQNTQHVLTL